MTFGQWYDYGTVKTITRKTRFKIDFSQEVVPIKNGSPISPLRVIDSLSRKKSLLYVLMNIHLLLYVYQIVTVRTLNK